MFYKNYTRFGILFYRILFFSTIFFVVPDIFIYCCPIKIGIDYYSLENAFKQVNYVLVSKSNPS